MTHETLQAFDEINLIKEYEHWKLLVRNRNTTLGNCVLIIKEDIREWGKVSKEANAELSEIIGALEFALKKAFNYDKINYLALMMKDPQVHFHVIPRYAEKREFAGLEWLDEGWPKMPPGKKEDLPPKILHTIKQEIQKYI